MGKGDYLECGANNDDDNDDSGEDDESSNDDGDGRLSQKRTPTGPSPRLEAESVAFSASAGEGPRSSSEGKLKGKQRDRKWTCVSASMSLQGVTK